MKVEKKLSFIFSTYPNANGDWVESHLDEIPK
jgi:hypothetical protein